MFYVIALFPHQLPRKVDPRRWQYQQSRDNAFRFLVCCVDAMEIGVAEFPGQVEMSPDVVDDLLEPSLAGEFLGANLVLVVDVVLLDLDPVMSEAAS